MYHSNWFLVRLSFGQHIVCRIYNISDTALTVKEPP